MHALPSALQGFAAWRQFIVWHLVPSVPKPDKVPVDWRSRAPANPHDPEIWLSADQAITIAQQFGPGYGVGFVFTEDDPFWFLDIDNALHEGQWSPVAQQLVQAFPGAAVEVSTSGKGLHIFGSGPLPEHGCRNKAFGLELYHKLRFVALTGVHAQGDCRTEHTAAVDWLVKSYFAPGAAGVEVDAVTTSPVPEWLGSKDDEDLLRRAITTKGQRALFGGGASFGDLWTCNVPVLAKAYPSDTGDEFNRSAADMALMQHLAFWTGKHGTRMLALMERSALKREKWVKHRSYLETTCLTALSRQLTVCHDTPVEPVALPGVSNEAPVQRAIEGSTFLAPAQQLDIFKGCVYVTEGHEVLVPGGDMLDQGRFKVAFGGYSFAMDNRNERVVRNAWEAFTESQALRPPKADTTCFKPSLAPGVIIRNGGRTAVNVWWPIEIDRAQGNPEPFLAHMRKLLPDERDFTIMLSYLAACVQHKGVKFQWAPLLQGVPGNGKTFISFCLMNAVGMRYCHMPRPTDISSKFNPWLRNKLVIAIEDVFVQNEQTEILEILKPMITGSWQPVEPKGVDQVTAEIVCNFIFNSNHRDALRKTDEERRIAHFFCPQQMKRDLAAWGMTRDYFANLHAWYQHGGMAVVNELLHTWAIPDEFNPALGGVAPETSSTATAIAASLGSIEQHILEAIARSEIGFMGGWVSSVYLDRMLEAKGYSRRVPPAKRRELMQSLGYDYHPGLVDGRVNNTILPDASKPRLYVAMGSPVAGIVGAAEIARVYSAAQMGVTG